MGVSSAAIFDRSLAQLGTIGNDSPYKGKSND